MNADLYVSPNVEWSLEPSTWFGQSLLVVAVLLALLQIFETQVAWSLTIWTYNMVTFIFFHAILGDPFNAEYSTITFWEQLVIQLKGSSGMTFFTAFPILLFLAGARIAKFNNSLFLLNFFSLMSVIIPKFLVYIRHQKKQGGAAARAGGTRERKDTGRKAEKRKDKSGHKQEGEKEPSPGRKSKHR